MSKLSSETNAGRRRTDIKYSSFSFPLVFIQHFYWLIGHLPERGRQDDGRSISEQSQLQKSADSHLCWSVTIHLQNFFTPRLPRSCHHDTRVHTSGRPRRRSSFPVYRLPWLQTASGTGPQTCWRTTREQRVEPWQHHSMRGTRRVSVRGCLCLCMNVIQGDSCCELKICVVLTPEQKPQDEAHTPDASFVKHTSPPPLRFRKVFVILWVSLYIMAWHRSKVV